jgi:cytochrome c oxidase subunit 4
MEENEPIEKHSHPKYLLVFLVLAVLTMMELGVIYLPDYLHPVLLLSLSFIKATLVVLYFMHLKTDSRWFAFIFLAPFLLVFPMVLVLRIN